jgi:hypothetical protein
MTQDDKFRTADYVALFAFWTVVVVVFAIVLVVTS